MKFNSLARIAVCTGMDRPHSIPISPHNTNPMNRNIGGAMGKCAGGVFQKPQN